MCFGAADYPSRSAAREASFTSRSRSATPRSPCVALGSELLLDPAAVFDRFLVVIRALLVAARQIYLFALRCLVGNQAEKVRQKVEARALFVVRAHDVPRRKVGVGCFQHHVPGARVVVPSLARW